MDKKLRKCRVCGRLGKNEFPKRYLWVTPHLCSKCMEPNSLLIELLEVKDGKVSLHLTYANMNKKITQQEPFIARAGDEILISGK